MGRGAPKYDLEHLQQLVGQGPISRLITTASRHGAGEFGWGETEIVEAILSLDPVHFYKSMEAEQRPGFWQDVYHLEYRGCWLYIKLQLAPDARAVVVQFKKR